MVVFQYVSYLFLPYRGNIVTNLGISMTIR